MNDFVKATLLYDVYSELLTKKQKQIFEMYYFNDLSLNEIGEQLLVSPQAIRDILKRTEKHLFDYESKLGLLCKHNQRIEIISCLKNRLEKADINFNDKEFNQKEQLFELLNDLV